MQVGSISATGPKNQSALKLITNIVETNKSDQSRQARDSRSGSMTTGAASVSSRSAAAIQDLVQGTASGTTTFKRLGGPDQTLPTDEYEFMANGIPQTLEQVKDEFLKAQLSGYPQMINQALDENRLDDASRYSEQFSALKSSLANGTFKIELLDDRVAGDYRWHGIRDSDGTVIGMGGEETTPVDWDSFYKIYGNGNGGYDKNYFVGGTAFIRQYVISF